MANKRFHKSRGGYTLIELIIVTMLIGILTVAGIAGLIRSRRALLFNAANQQVGSLVREARSLAVTGKAILDYGDYDNDLLDDGDGDYVTPAHYGIHFDVGNNMLILFADLDDSNNVGAYDGTLDFNEYVAASGRDLKIGEYQVTGDLELLAEGSTGTTTNTVMFSPIFADVAFSNAAANTTLTNEFFVFGLRETNVTDARENCLAIHPIAGVPETTDATSTACP